MIPHSASDILDPVDDLAERQDEIAVGDVVETLGHRGFGPFPVIIPLIDISPIGSIPGLPIAMAVIVVMIAEQMAWEREHLWLPGFIARRAIASDKVGNAMRHVRGVARFPDCWCHGRLPALTKGPFVRAAAFGCMPWHCACRRSSCYRSPPPRRCWRSRRSASRSPCATAR